MRQWWIRLILVACVLATIVAGLAIQARPDPFPGDTSRCPWPPCTDTCVSNPDPGALRICTEGKRGKTVFTTYACCCCNEDAKNRWFHGG